MWRSAGAAVSEIDLCSKDQTRGNEFSGFVTEPQVTTSEGQKLYDGGDTVSEK